MMIIGTALRCVEPEGGRPYRRRSQHAGARPARRGCHRADSSGRCGGIADARGGVAALALGAEAVVLGTRFLATPEARAHPVYKQKLLEATETDTVRTILFGHGWPYAPHRALRTAFVSQWQGQEERGQESRPDEPVIGQTTIAGQPMPLQRFMGFPPNIDARGDIESMGLKRTAQRILYSLLHQNPLLYGLSILPANHAIFPPGGMAMDNIIIDLGKSLSDIMAMIGFPPEPTALLERVKERLDDPDIAGLVAVIQDQGRALKAAQAVVDQLFTHLAGQAIAAGLTGEVEEAEASALSGTGMELEPDESIIAALVDRMRPRLDDPGIKELVLALELQTLSLKRANKRIAEMLDRATT